MFAHLPRRETDPQGTRPQAAARKAGARLRWLAMLAAVTSGLLASAATIPAAFARVVPEPGGNYGHYQSRAGTDGHRPGGYRRRHARLADHRDRAGGSPARGRRGRRAGPGAGPPPGCLFAGRLT